MWKSRHYVTRYNILNWFYLNYFVKTVIFFPSAYRISHDKYKFLYCLITWSVTVPSSNIEKRDMIKSFYSLKRNSVLIQHTFAKTRNSKSRKSHGENRLKKSTESGSERYSINRKKLAIGIVLRFLTLLQVYGTKHIHTRSSRLL